MDSRDIIDSADWDFYETDPSSDEVDIEPPPEEEEPTDSQWAEHFYNCPYYQFSRKLIPDHGICHQLARCTQVNEPMCLTMEPDGGWEADMDYDSKRRVGLA